MSEKVLVEYSEDELAFLHWAMQFIEGGIGGPEERQRSAAEFKFRKALSDQQEGTIYRASRRPVAIECAFCEGGGVFPDILPSDGVETEPCIVCHGTGFNMLSAAGGDIVRCRFCAGEGKAWDSSGYATEDVCQVCNGQESLCLRRQEALPSVTAFGI